MLRNIVHAGGVLEDAALRNQTAAHVRNVFAPKLGAALGLSQVRACLWREVESKGSSGFKVLRQLYEYFH